MSAAGDPGVAYQLTYPDKSSARLGVSFSQTYQCLSENNIFDFTGSKERLDRAKTIDLCQNPLTVRIHIH